MPTHTLPTWITPEAGYFIDRNVCSAVVMKSSTRAAQAHAIAALEEKTRSWYEWNGRLTGIEGNKSRAVKLSQQQPTHLIRFDQTLASGKITTKTWLVMADEHNSDGSLYDTAPAWTHSEWKQDLDDGGDWSRVRGHWLYRGASLPGIGTVTVTKLGADVIRLDDRRKL